MIYIDDAVVQSHTILLPKSTAAPFAGAVLVFFSTVDRTQTPVTIEYITEDGDYYRIRADFSALNTPGEYEATLSVDGQILAQSVAVVGEMSCGPAYQYDKQVTFEQYEPGE